MFNSTVRTSKPHRIGPDAGQGRVVNVKLKINRLSGFRAPTNQITHRVAHKSKKRERLARSLLAAWLVSSREVTAAGITCAPLERRLVSAFRYPRFQCGGLDPQQLLSDRHLHL